MVKIEFVKEIKNGKLEVRAKILTDDVEFGNYVRRRLEDDGYEWTIHVKNGDSWVEVLLGDSLDPDPVEIDLKTEKFTKYVSTILDDYENLRKLEGSFTVTLD